MKGARALPRPALRAIAMAIGVVLFGAFYFSPFADVAVTSLASAQARSGSQRDLFYPGTEAMRDPSGYARATAGQPPDRHSLLLMGSSELSSLVPQNPRVFLPARVSDFDLYMSGRGHTQSLYHAIELAATAGDLRDKKVALIVSPQWFVSGGIPPGAFQEVFSDAAWQRMLDDPRLTPATRGALIARGSTLMRGVLGFDAPSGDGILGEAARILLTPYEALIRRGRLLRLESKSPQASLPYTVAPGSVPIETIDWTRERQVAEAEGAAVVHDDFYVADPYYAKYIRPNLAQLKDTVTPADYSADSPEYSDLELFLDVARETGVQVLLISVPMNGRWYQYLGYGTDRRAAYYARIRNIAERYGVQLADFSGDEFEPYFLYDVQHLGWIGWLDVLQACVRFERS